MNQKESRGNLDWPQESGTLVIPALNGVTEREGICHAAVILREGGMVAFPTETVYGLGADALNARAVARVFAAKGRPADNPMIVHIYNPAQMDELAWEIPPEAYVLARRFWPGPLTLVLRSKKVVPAETTGGLDSIALRIPAHPVALALLQEAGLPVAAPSANLSGKPSPTTARHVLDDLAGRIDAVLDGGSCDVGVESTVLDIRNGQPLVLRPGGVTPADIASVLERECRLASWQESDAGAPLSPGLKYTHYAPQAPLYLVCGQREAVLARLQGMLDHFHAMGKSVGLLLSTENAGKLLGEHLEILGSRDKPAVLAANLYCALRRFDLQGVDIILAEGYPSEGIGLALMNRLSKAAGHRVIHVE